MNQHQSFNRSKDDDEHQQKEEMKAQQNYAEMPQQQETEQVLYNFQYYQSNDLVFAFHEDYLWPSKVVQPLNDYTSYEILLFQYKFTVEFPLNMLLDYTPENKQKSLETFNNRERSKKMMYKYQLAMKDAERHHKILLKREKDKKFEQVIAKHMQIEKAIEQQIERDREQQMDQTRIHENVQNVFRDQIERQAILPAPSLKVANYPILQAQSSENLFPKGIAQNKKRQELIGKPNFSLNQTNTEFNIFRKQKERLKQVTQMFIKPHRHSQEINEEDKNMVMFLSRYEYFFSEIDRHLDTLKNIEEPVRVKICQNAIDKIVKALTQPEQSTFKICSFFPLLRIIFSSYANPFISIDKIVGSNILARILLLIKSYDILPVKAYKQEYELFTSYCREVKQHYLIGDQCGVQTKMKIDELYKKFRFF